MIAPGATIGILGGGQLGRMLAVAAARLGYRAHVYAPLEEDAVAAHVAAAVTRADYGDLAALDRFAAVVDVVTFEFENVPVEAARHLERRVPVRPGARAFEVAQDRLAEKAFAREHGGRTAPYREVATLADLEAAAAALGGACVLKTRRLGYDGKGQARLAGPAEAGAAWEAIGGAPAILEGLVRFEAEFSVLLARGADGAVAVYDAVVNEHADGILRRSSVPVPPGVAAQVSEAAALTARIADALDYVGVLAAEFFACADGPVFNEMAPRVHNSGHWTIEGAAISQFENHVRAVCGLPLGRTRALGPATMTNLIGDDAAAWPEILAEPGAALHLYGKAEARAGRKMGHVTRRG